MKEIRFDYDALRKRIRLHSGSVQQFAKDIGMSYLLLLSRLNGKSYFTVQEVKAIKKQLGLTPQATKQCFFTLKENPFAG